MIKTILTTIFAIMSFISHAQINKTYWGVTFLNTDFLNTYQTDSNLLPSTKNEGLDRLVVNHQFSSQYHFLIKNRLELNIGFGMNLQYYSVKIEEDLFKVRNFLNIEQDLLPDETYDEVVRIRFNNINLTAPIGMKFFLKKDPLEGAQPAFSVQFLTERNVHSRVNARYIVDYNYSYIFSSVSRSSHSSIDSEIERFYEKNVTKMTHSLRVGFSFQNGGGGDVVRHSSFDVHYVHYFESFDSGITAAAKGISCAWKWQF